MRVRSYRSRLLVVTIAVLAVLIVAIPTCQMVGCRMSMRMWPLVTTGLVFSAPTTCGGSFVFSQAPTAVLPSGAEALLVALFAAFAIAAATLFAPRAEIAPVRVARIEPPPQPDASGGERLRI